MLQATLGTKAASCNLEAEPKEKRMKPMRTVVYSCFACFFFAGSGNACVENIYTARGAKVGFSYCVGAVQKYLEMTGEDTGAFGRDSMKRLAAQIDKSCTTYNSSITGPSVDDDIQLGRAAMSIAIVAQDAVEVESLVRTCERLFDEHLR